MDRIRKRGWLCSIVLGLALSMVVLSAAQAFNQPPYNLGLTNAFDGAIPGPGLYLMAYTQFYSADELAVNDDVPQPVRSILEDTELIALSAAWQIAWITKLELLGAFLGWNVVIPVVVFDTDGPINSFVRSLPIPGDRIEDTGGLGDIITGPVIQWSGKSLFSRPYFHRIELDVIVPTGKYSDDFLINAGSNIVTFNPYYAFTWFPTPKTDVSFRIHYAWNSTNKNPYESLYGPDAELQPGQNFHFNYTLQQNLYKSLWMGAAGYCMWQLTDDDLKDSALEGTPLADALVQKERVFGIGPILTITPIKNMFLSWATAFEVGVKNRPEGFKTTFKILYGF
ncbi:MAG: transporter [bacterium]